MYFPRNNILAASLAEGVRKLRRDPDLISATEIEISNVRMAEIPDEIFAAKGLKSLTITEARLKAVSPRIGELAELEELNLAGNALETMPPEVEGLASLEALDLSCNRFRDFPVAVARIRSPARLNLAENRLASVDPCVCKLENLSDPDASGPGGVHGIRSRDAHEDARRWSSVRSAGWRGSSPSAS